MVPGAIEQVVAALVSRTIGWRSSTWGRSTSGVWGSGSFPIIIFFITRSGTRALQRLPDA
jgi:hypothetical protein